MIYRPETPYSTKTGEFSGEMQTHRPLEDLMHYFVEYAREKPEVAALWCFGIGFVLGWKLKPW
jgi:hypothetical protein